MSKAVYEISSDGEEHVYSVPCSASMRGKDITKDINFIKISMKCIYVALSFQTVMILALVGISAHLLQIQQSNVVDQVTVENLTSRAVLDRLAKAEVVVTRIKSVQDKTESEVLGLKSALVSAKAKITNRIVADQNVGDTTSEAVVDRLTKAEAAVTTIKSDQDKTETEVWGLKNALVNAEAKITNLIETCHTEPVMFSAKSVTDDSVTNRVILRFDHVTVNLGNGYNRLSGYFTAPRSGTYLFHTSVCAKTDKWVYVNIMANGVPLVTTGTKENEFNGVCTSASAMVQLRAKALVWVEGVWNGTEAIYSRASYSTPTFSGTLIHCSV